MNNPKKLNIRIKFAPQKPEVIPEVVPEETGYIYHWKRIVGASLLVVTTLIVIIYSAFDSSAQSDTMTQSAESKIQATNPASVKESVIQAQPDREPVISPSSNIQKNSMSLTTEKTSVKQTQPDRELVITPDNSNQKNSISLTTEKAAQKNNVSASLLTQSASEIFSEQIKPFVIAKTVKDKEPIGTIDDIKLDANNIVTVYAYSKVVGLKGETLYYKWRLNGKDIAQVKVRVRSDRWRSYSRKFIQSHMQGDWSVALENSKGELLALNRFQY